MLNIPRVNFRAAVSHMQGAKCAKGDGMPFAMFDAIAMSEEEAALIQDDVNARREVDEAMRDARS